MPLGVKKHCKIGACSWPAKGKLSTTIINQYQNDSILLVKAEGRSYIFVCDGDDEGFVRFIHPNFWEIESAEELGRALAAASAVSRRCKFVKVHLKEDMSDTSAVIEFFDKNGSVDKKTTLRYLSALQAGVNMFREEMQKGMK